jgi:transcriptional regulator with XRE-family HTH domain
MEDDVVSFWKRVNSHIKSQKTKQEAIASECNISYQTFRGWRTNKRYPSTPETYRIAQALHTSVEYLVTGENPDNSAIIESIRKHLKNIENDVNRLK